MSKRDNFRPDHDVLAGIYQELQKGTLHSEIAKRHRVVTSTISKWMNFYQYEVLGTEGCRAMKKKRDEAARQFTKNEIARRRAEIMAPVALKATPSIKDLCKPVMVPRRSSAETVEAARFG